MVRFSECKSRLGDDCQEGYLYKVETNEGSEDHISDATARNNEHGGT